MSKFNPPIILASSSKYRANLLNQLTISFESHSPDIDETPLNNETPEQLVIRLAISKAKAVKNAYSEAIIIGSDQVAVLNDKIITKPGNHANAVEQLLGSQGQELLFLTSLCVLNAKTGSQHEHVEKTLVKFRALDKEDILRYLSKEPAYDCAGSFKSESLGISLLESINSNDPNALIGLPLIKLVNFLSLEGISIP